MLTVELRVLDKDGVQVFREVFETQPCGKYEVEVEGMATFSARVTQWELVDGQYQPVNPVG